LLPGRRRSAASELGFAVLLAAAAIWWERRLALAAGAAFPVATNPQHAYHAVLGAAMAGAYASHKCPKVL
jgi:hypothetical protein